MDTENGALDICIVKNEAVGLVRHDPVFTGLQITFDEWEELYYNVLGVPKPEPFREGESFILYEQRQKRLFAQHVQLMGYNMLSKIQDIYDDVEYVQSEVILLLEECERLMGTQISAAATLTLEKLISGCDRAMKNDSSLILTSD